MFNTSVWKPSCAPSTRQVIRHVSLNTVAHVSYSPCFLRRLPCNPRHLIWCMAAQRCLIGWPAHWPFVDPSHPVSHDFFPALLQPPLLLLQFILQSLLNQCFLPKMCNSSCHSNVCNLLGDLYVNSCLQNFHLSLHSHNSQTYFTFDVEL